MSDINVCASSSVNLGLLLVSWFIHVLCVKYWLQLSGFCDKKAH